MGNLSVLCNQSVALGAGHYWILLDGIEEGKEVAAGIRKHFNLVAAALVGAPSVHNVGVVAGCADDHVDALGFDFIVVVHEGG